MNVNLQRKYGIHKLKKYVMWRNTSQPLWKSLSCISELREDGSKVFGCSNAQGIAASTFQVIAIFSGPNQVQAAEGGEEGWGGGLQQHQGGEVPLRDGPHPEDGGDKTCWWSRSKNTFWKGGEDKGGGEGEDHDVREAGGDSGEALFCFNVLWRRRRDAKD